MKSASQQAPGSRLSVWSCLHDGSIEAVSLAGSVVQLTVGCLYAADYMGRPTHRFVVEVEAPVRWEPWDAEAEVDSLEALVALEPEIMGPDDGRSEFALQLLLPSGKGGALVMPGRSWLLRWEDGDAIDPSLFVETVDRGVQTYVEGLRALT